MGPGDIESGLVFRYEAGLWTAVNPLVTPRHWHACTAYMGQIWAIGGWRQSSVEIYDPLRDSWEQGQSFPEAMYLAHVTVFQDRVYYIGGWRTGTPNTEVFTFMGGSWQVVPGVSVEDYSRSVFPAPIVNTDVLFTPTGSSSKKNSLYSIIIQYP